MTQREGYAADANGASRDAPTPGGERPLLDVRDLHMYFPVTSGLILQRRIGDVKAVDGVSFSINRGETLGLVGESGSGKTTVGRCIMQLNESTSGEIWLDDVNLCTVKGSKLRAMRRRMQMVFQDPYSSLNPRMNIGAIVGEPLTVHKLVTGKRELREQVAEMLRVVGLNPSMADRFPHEFSGGQRQRIGIARAIAVRPELIVADEPVSALDVSIQAQLINLLQDIQEQFGLTFLFIAHDLSVVRHMSENLAVMYLGKVMEITGRQEMYEHPLHPYTQALLSAVPVPSPRMEAQRDRVILQGSIPSPIAPPPGCVFHTRCPIATQECQETVPPLREYAPNHYAACIKL